VLTADDYAAMEDRDKALRGTVQGLMVTGHLLFVGYSLADADFIELASPVRRVRLQADVTADQASAGTVLALRAGDVEASSGAADLAVLAMLEADSDAQSRKSAGRLLEVFLDRVAWTASRQDPEAAQYLLDARYDEGFTEQPDVDLREALVSLIDGLPPGAVTSSAWPIVEKALLALGGKDRMRGLPTVSR
jgi:hypothetical protein